MWLKVILVILFVDGNIIAGHRLPDKLQRCHLSNPDLDSCLNDAISAAISFIGSKGIPSLGCPPIDPLQAKEYVIEKGGLIHHYYDPKLYGYSQVKISKAHLDMDKKFFTFTTFGNYTQVGRYNLSGHILQMPLSGEGDSTLMALDTTIRHDITFKENKKEDETYWIIDKYFVKMSVKGASFDFKNLFNGNKLLADNIIKLMNENWETVAGEMIGGLEQAYSIVLKSVGNSIFMKVPFSEIFPK